MPEGTDVWYGRIAGAPDLGARARVYDDWSTEYDADMLSVGYMNPPIVAALVSRHVPVHAAILDVGAGTGIIGAVLKPIGYAHLEALDMSDGMLAQAERRNVYRALHQAVLGSRLAFEDATFDAVIACGILVLGGAPPAAIDEIVRITVPGGAIIITANEPAWNQGGFRARADELEGTGRWRRIDESEPYRPAPLSITLTHAARAFVYRREG